MDSKTAMPRKIEDSTPNNIQKVVLGSGSRTAKFRRVVTELVKRCQQASLDHHPKKIEATTEVFSLSLRTGHGQSQWNISVTNDDSAELLEACKFEKIQGIDGYMAIFSPEARFVEALLETPRTDERYEYLSNYLRKVSFGVQMAAPLIELSCNSGQFIGTVIKVGPSTDIFKALLSLRSGRYDWWHQGYLSLQIHGPDVNQHHKAKSILELISNSLFFELDISHDIHLGLSRGSENYMGHPASTRQLGDQTLLEPPQEFPDKQYDHQAMQLYWYARGAKGMPLIQYLAFYQVLEHHYPRFIASLQDSKERKLLIATLKSCISQEELTKFLTKSPNHKSFFASKAAKQISEHRPSLRSSNSYLIEEVARRIYDIRCRIVHTKSSGKSTQSSPILPFSEEAELLRYDLELVQLCARKVLSSTATSFSAE